MVVIMIRVQCKYVDAAATRLDIYRTVFAIKLRREHRAPGTTGTNHGVFLLFL